MVGAWISSRNRADGFTQDVVGGGKWMGETENSGQAQGFVVNKWKDNGTIVRGRMGKQYERGGFRAENLEFHLRLAELRPFALEVWPESRAESGASPGLQRQP